MAVASFTFETFWGEKRKLKKKKKVFLMFSDCILVTSSDESHTNDHRLWPSLRADTGSDFPQTIKFQASINQ